MKLKLKLKSQFRSTPMASSIKMSQFSHMVASLA